MEALNPDVLSRDGTFASNRATGHVAFSVSACGGASRRARVREASSLRVRFPNAQDASTLEAVIINTAGGMTGGDRFDMNIEVGAGARLAVTTAAAEKIYRSLGPDTDVAAKFVVGPGATLFWLPQETIMFDRARLHRTIDVDLGAGASLVLAEAIVFGRAAMGETLTWGKIFDRRRVHAGGALIFAETMRLDGAIAERLGCPAVAGGGAAIASVLKIPGNDEAVAMVRDLQETFIGEVGVSTWKGVAAARLVAADSALLRHDLICVLTAWSGRKLPRLWLN